MTGEEKVIALFIASAATAIVLVVAIYNYACYADTKMHIDAGHERRMVPSSYTEVWVDPKSESR